LRALHDVVFGKPYVGFSLLTAEFRIIKSSSPIICDPHNLRTRSIGANYAVEVHVRLPEDMPVVEAHELTKKIELMLKERFGKRTHIIVHVEPIK
jgi:divalent metal cation (Fe/Co/Zn/Cd) transporter